MCYLLIQFDDQAIVGVQLVLPKYVDLCTMIWQILHGLQAIINATMTQEIVAIVECIAINNSTSKRIKEKH